MSLLRNLTRRGSAAKIPILYRHPELSSSVVPLQLYSWGRGASGQLGGGVEELRIYPSIVADFLLPPSFSLSFPSGRLAVGNHGDFPGTAIGMSCGLFHSSVYVDGSMWIWGKGDGGRLGFGHEDPAFVPTLNENVENVRSVALGGLHSVALNSDGQVFTWGYGGFGALGHGVYHRELLPKMVEGSWTGKICRIATSGTHTAAVTESGELYTWGREEGDGRLGLGPGRGPDHAGGLSIPSEVKALPVPVSAVCCGGFFTVALTKDGQVWNWGANSNFELGRGNKVGGWEPKPNANLEGLHIVQIAAGGYHSLALSDDGKVFSWGHGGHGQLGHSSLQSQKVPLLIEALRNERVVYVACGGSTSAAVTEEGKLYMWGNSRDSQLGVPGLPETQESPVEVKFLEEEDGMGAYKVLAIEIGASHAMCLISRSSFGSENITEV